MSRPQWFAGYVIGMAAGFFVMLAGSLRAAPSQYKIIDLGVFPGGYGSQAYGINDAGQVVGEGDNAGGNTHGFLFTGGAIVDLGILSGGSYSHARSINNSGQVTGYADALFSSSYNSENTPHLFLYTTNGGIQNLGTFPPTTTPGLSGSYSEGLGINNLGQIAGYGEVSYLATDSGEHSFIFSGAFHDIGTVPAPYNYGSEAAAINDAGQVVGVSYDSGYENHAFLYSGGAMHDLGTLGGSISEAKAINNSGQVVGDSQTTEDVSTHTFLFSSGTMQDLGGLSNLYSPYSFGRGINNSGQIVGYANGSQGSDAAFLYTDGIMYDLNSLVSAANLGTMGYLSRAYGINSNGWIVGYGDVAGQYGVVHAFLAIPVQSPVITAQPQSQTNLTGATAVFSVTANGASPLSYQWLKNSSTLANSARLTGATSNTLTLGSLATTDAGEYSVIVSNSLGSPTSSNAILTVLIPDTTAPTLAIVSPMAKQQVSNAVLAVMGTARDNVAVAAVFCSANGSGWSAASTQNHWTNWMGNIDLVPGANTISAYAVDTSGNASLTNKVAINFIPSATLVVLTTGAGGVIPNNNGKLLALGTNYTLTASPGHNTLFSNWVGGTTLSYAVLSTNLVYKFTMQSNLVLQANFVTNLFLAAQGAYHGLFAPTTPPRQQTNSGSFTLNVTSTGVLTGDLFLGSETIPLTGKFDVSGAAQIPPIPKSKNPLTTTLQLDLANKSVQGSVTDGSFTALLSGDQVVFSVSHPATNYEGQYTLIIPGTNAPANGPYGTSYGTVTVDALGNVLFGGSLADGTSVGQSSVVSKDGNWPFYLPLYDGAGSLWGMNYFTNHTIISAPFLSWINATNSTKTAVYRLGFTNQESSVIGSFYTSTSKPLLSINSAQVVLEADGPPISITNQITWASNNTITVPHIAENTNGLTLATTKTGLISGSFLNPTNAKQIIKFNGVLMQNQTNAAGYFLEANQSGAFTLDPPYR